MSTGSVFVNNRTQAVRLPADARFPNEVKQVSARPETTCFCEYLGRINSSGRWLRSSVAN